MPDISNADYHADPAISASHLHAVAQSPYHYWARYLDPNRQPVEPTPAMRFGSLVHCAVLEPDELGERYSRCAPRNTKAGKEEAADLAARGIEVVTDRNWASAIAMNRAVRQHPAAAALLQAGKAEQSFWWDDADTGMRCKCRPDWLNGAAVVDLKTTTDASPRGFAKSVATFRYHVQASHYLAGLGAERFLFIAVENTYPHPVAVYELDAEALQLGNELRQRDMRVIADCRATGEWPGYSADVEALNLPKWSLNPDSTILTSDDF